MAIANIYEVVCQNNCAINIINNAIIIIIKYCSQSKDVHQFENNLSKFYEFRFFNLFYLLAQLAQSLKHRIAHNVVTGINVHTKA